MISRKGILFGKVLSLVPKRLRYGAARRLSSALLPFMRLSPRHRDMMRWMHVERDSDFALGTALSALDTLDVTYDPRIRLEGEEVLRESLQTGRGTLLVGAHALLLQMVIPRALTDSGYPFQPVAVTPTVRVSGTPHRIPSIQVSPKMLFRVRSALLRGELVCALIDWASAVPRHTKTSRTTTGEFHVSDPLLRLAVACQARVLFMMSRTDKSGAVRCTISAPATGADATPDALLIDFANTIVAHMARP